MVISAIGWLLSGRVGGRSPSLGICARRGPGVGHLPVGPACRPGV